jgi:Rod binding domain-containing protein
VTASGMTGAQAMLAGNSAAGRVDAFSGPSRGTKDPKTAATQTSALFYSMMLSEMEKSVPKNDYLGGKGEDTFRSLWVNATGKSMASRSGDPLTATILKTIQKSMAAKAYSGGDNA